MITIASVQAFLAARGKTGLPAIDFILLGDDSPGSPCSFPVWDVVKLGAAPTVADIAAMRTSTFQATSRQKDILATIALTVRARIGIAAWNALTTQQKVTQTLAEADVWTTIRDFIEANM